MTVDWVGAFPASLGPAVRAVETRLPPADHESQGFVHETNHGRLPAPSVGGEMLMIPARIYNPCPRDGLRASGPVEATLLACIYSRHHDGYVRQAAALALLKNVEPFVAPFLVQLLGEYVLEIVVDIAEQLEAEDRLRTALAEFARENPRFMDLTTDRAYSYWAEYHRRRYVSPQDYPAIRVLSQLRSSDPVRNLTACRGLVLMSSGDNFDDLRTDRTRAVPFEDELVREVSEAHPLHGRPWTLIARAFPQDEVVIVSGDEVALVHLTWRQGPESPPWPSTQFFATAAEFDAAIAERY